MPSRKVNLSEDVLSLDFISSWNEKLRIGLNIYKSNIISNILSGSPHADSDMDGLTIDEIDAHFDILLDELDKITSINYLSSSEGKFKSNYFSRVKAKKRDKVSRVFREIHKGKNDKTRVSLIDDILKSYLNNDKRINPQYSELTGVIDFRNWLAHGRYWRPKNSLNYTSAECRSKIENFLARIDLRE